MLAVPLVLAIFWGSNLVAADCQKTTAIETLDLKSLEGNWYQLSSFGTMFIHGLNRCAMTTITEGSDGKSFVMANDRIARLINTHIKYNWDVETKGDKPSGDLTLRFKLPVFGTVSLPMKILGTDYKNYIILYVCREFASIFKFNAGYILTRKRHYNAKELESIYSSIDHDLSKNGIPRSRFSLSIQTNCEDNSSSSDTDSATSTDKASAAVSQTAGSSPAAPEPTTAAEHSHDKTAEEQLHTSDSQKTASVTEKATTSDTEKAAVLTK